MMYNNEAYSRAYEIVYTEKNSFMKRKIQIFKLIIKKIKQVILTQ